ncbi:MAG: family 20 glycosylhydrolase, partial [Chlorobi bacterium]|nr:family 20 glycosylhydrolase [Chlorobiota bacterium]
GMHLDVGRHMFPVSFIKKYIDYLAMHKLNAFHWHLTEDQGWRIEIKKYPRLTEIGAWRKGTQIGKTAEIDSVRYGGFYTQDEAREIVDYAAKRFITVVPEIEMPGHSLAALASYPFLACASDSFEVGTKWGVYENIYCAGNDSVFTFLEDVLTEVMDLFPSKYIHIGGDEAPKTKWKECPKCQARIKNENLKDESELQSYFIARIEKFLNEHGRQIIGWDEILEGGLAPNADVMSWRGITGGIEAAKLKHNVVMTPGSHCYFDHYQSAPEGEPLAIGGFLPLEKVYSYEPIPEELNKDERKYIIGVQGNVWTEYIATPEQVEYMALPRMCALAEVAWSPVEKRDTKNFLERMNKHYERLDAMNVNYRCPSLTGFEYENVFIDDAVLEIIPGQKNRVVRYTSDGSEPNSQSKIYTEPIKITETTTFKFCEFKSNGKRGKIYTASYEKQMPLEPVADEVESKGLNFELFKLKEIISSLTEMKNLKPLKTGVIEDFVFPYSDENLPQRFGVKYSGYIEIPEEDVYTFSVVSDDGTQLFIDKRLVVDNDGQHGPVEKSGQLALKKGLHEIELLYFQVGGPKTLQVFMKQDGEEKEEISGKILWH